MNATYSTKYRDEQGEETTSIHNDGSVLTMIVRGVKFESSFFYDFESVDLPGNYALPPCVLTCVIPVPIHTSSGRIITPLTVVVNSGIPEPRRRGKYDALKLQLEIENRLFYSRSPGGWFEEALNALQQQLEVGTYIECCLNCAFSDYSPYGNGGFGGLACFRDNKTEYLKVHGKSIFAIWDTLTEFVQETYLCPQFEKRKPGTGYRG